MFIFKFFRLFFLKRSRRFKKSLGLLFNIFGITFSQISDGFFFGGICLLFLRFFFRLFFSLNPFWEFNLFVYLLGFVIQLRFNVIKDVREVFVKIMKVLLGENYWYVHSFQELINFTKSHGFGVFMPAKNIFERSFFNFFFQQLFIFFILFRLWILKSPFKFVFFNFLFTLFLIFNKFFIFSSLISFMILLSRLSLFASDYTTKDFYDIINLVEPINPKKGEYIETSWENAELIGLIVSRTFNDREQHRTRIMDEHDKIIQLKNTVFRKYIQINKKFALFSDEQSCFMSGSWRLVAHNDYIKANGQTGYEYISILKINRKNLFLNVL